MASKQSLQVSDTITCPCDESAAAASFGLLCFVSLELKLFEVKCRKTVVKVASLRRKCQILRPNKGSNHLFKMKNLHFAPNMFCPKDDIKVSPSLTLQAFDWLSVSAVFNRGYNESRRVLAVLDQTGAEDRVQTLSEAGDEGVEMQTRLHIVERNLSSFIIQEDSHFTELGLQHQRQAGRRQNLHLPVLQPQAPVPPFGTQLDLALAAGRGAGHAERPGRLAPHVHLPVVSPRAEALSAQDEEGGAETLRAL